MTPPNGTTAVERFVKIAIAKDGWPVEFIEGKPVINFLRRMIHTHHYECRNCWYNNQAMKAPGSAVSNSPFSL